MENRLTNGCRIIHICFIKLANYSAIVNLHIGSREVDDFKLSFISRELACYFHGVRIKRGIS